jgi:hypothetical protein
MIMKSPFLPVKTFCLPVFAGETGIFMQLAASLPHRL